MADSTELNISAKANFGQVNAASEATAAEVKKDTSSMQSAWQRLSASVAESMQGVSNAMRGAATTVSVASTEMKTKLVETAEAANLAKGGFNAFGAATALLGAGAGIGMIVELAHRSSEAAIEIGNLSDVTGLQVKTLSEFQYVAARQDVAWGDVTKSITKYVTAIDKARNGGSEQEAAFKRLGVSMEELKTKSPEEILMKIADYLDKLESPAQRAAAMAAIFGKGWRDTANFLKGGSEAIKELMANADALGGVLNDEAVASAREFDDTMDDLSQTLKSVAIPLIEATSFALKFLTTGFDMLLMGIIVLGRTSKAILMTLLDGVVGVGKALWKLASGDLSGAKQAASESIDAIKGDWKTALTEMQDAATTFDKIQKGLWAKPGEKPKGNKIGLGDDDGASSPKATKDTRLAEWQQELQQYKDNLDGLHTYSKQKEADFWDEKLNLQKNGLKQGSEIYNQVMHLYRAAQQEADREILKNVDETERAKIELTERGSKERIQAIEEALAKENALGSGAQQTEAYKSLLRMKAEADRQYSEARIKQQEKEFAAIQRMSKEISAADKQAAEASAEYAKQEADYKLQVGTLNQKKYLAELKRILDEEFRAKKAAVQREFDFLNKESPDYPNQVRNIQNQVAALEQKHRVQSRALDQKAMLDKRKMWNDLFGSIKNGFSGTIQGMIQGTQTFAQGMANLFNNILMSFVNMLVNMMVDWVAKWLFMHLFKKSLDQSGAQASVQAAAAVAGANGTASWALAPWPIDAGAPGFGASMAAAAGAYSALAFAEKGALLPDDQLVYAHKNEMILPANISTPMRSMLDKGTFGGSGGQFNVRSNVTIQALDGASVQRVMEENSDFIGKMTVKRIKQAVKRGEFRGGSF